MSSVVVQKWWTLLSAGLCKSTCEKNMELLDLLISHRRYSPCILLGFTLLIWQIPNVISQLILAWSSVCPDGHVVRWWSGVSRSENDSMSGWERKWSFAVCASTPITSSYVTVLGAVRSFQAWRGSSKKIKAKQKENNTFPKISSLEQTENSVNFVTHLVQIWKRFDVRMLTCRLPVLVHGRKINCCAQLRWSFLQSHFDNSRWMVNVQHKWFLVDNHEPEQCHSYGWPTTAGPVSIPILRRLRVQASCRLSRLHLKVWWTLQSLVCPRAHVCSLNFTQTRQLRVEEHFEQTSSCVIIRRRQRGDEMDSWKTTYEQHIGSFWYTLTTMPENSWTR